MSAEHNLLFEQKVQLLLSMLGGKVPLADLLFTWEQQLGVPPPTTNAHEARKLLLGCSRVCRIVGQVGNERSFMMVGSEQSPS